MRGLARGVSRPTPRGRLRGLARGASRPTPRGEVEGSGQGGLQAHTQGVSRPTSGGVSRPTPGAVCASQHALRQTPPQLMATATGGAHPTGMHSCNLNVVIDRNGRVMFSQTSICPQGGVGYACYQVPSGRGG